MLRVIDDAGSGEAPLHMMPLDELARVGAQRMLKLALEAEVGSYIERHQEERDEQGRALVVRNGKANSRQVTVGSGTFEVTAPRVNDKRVDQDGDRQRFTSKILPPYMRHSPKVAEVLPILYLRGLSTGDFKEALPVLLGEDAGSLSASAITRCTTVWEEEYRTFQERDLSDRDYVYVWADGIHFNVRLESDRLCTLVLIGVRPDGTKEVIAVEDGFRESTESWSCLLRRLTKQGLKAPALAIGDGALGFWAAVRDVWPETREQRCWIHRMANVLDKFPKSIQPKVKAMLQDMMNAESLETCEEIKERFVEDFDAKYPKAVKSLKRDWEKLVTHFDFPAEHWRHVRTTNVIESPFATVRLRQRVTKGAGSRIKGLTFAWKLLDMAQLRWRRLNGSSLLPLVRAGVKYVNGLRAERATRIEDNEHAA